LVQGLARPFLRDQLPFSQAQCVWIPSGEFNPSHSFRHPHLFHIKESLLSRIGKEKALRTKKFQNIKQDKGSFPKFLKSLKRLEDQEAIKILTQTFTHMGKYSAGYYLHSVGYWG
jgi:hypothetical protein